MVMCYHGYECWESNLDPLYKQVLLAAGDVASPSLVSLIRLYQGGKYIAWVVTINAFVVVMHFVGRKESYIRALCLYLKPIIFSSWYHIIFHIMTSYTVFFLRITCGFAITVLL